ncbi:putative HTH-type transcriptional regulator [Zhongshania aliphaticivorans]|uniref:Putative HTH-type transcriptional regulator n=1 Tax=Zhongshania aliphaticivorans TaxID=1470434 RepID=A0A5S9NP69_9GAMM|nr:TetR/AcrR family transcriptional regulator [Zhongshania aliphaticivorans]CAA0092193.1 putative HTH-type transcriptional regulator [Zhongshania aliphaticivorans]
MVKKKRFRAAELRVYDAALRLYAEKGSYDITVSELASAAGVARGTVYKHLESPKQLFNSVATRLASEMDERIAASNSEIDSPAARLATGIRLYIRRAHENPHWGRFLIHFGLTAESLRELWTGPPSEDIQAAVEAGEFNLDLNAIPSAVALLGGATLTGILLVLDGLKTWREAGIESAELTLRAFGLDAQQAKKIANSPLTELKEIK